MRLHVIRINGRIAKTSEDIDEINKFYTLIKKQSKFRNEKITLEVLEVL